MKKTDNWLIGFVGWRGMVGSVLMERMTVENDFMKMLKAGYNFRFYSTSDAGGRLPHKLDKTAQYGDTLYEAKNIFQLKRCGIILSCQGGKYTEKVYPKLRKAGWNGIWIDAASTLRMRKKSIIVLDPINRKQIVSSLSRKKRMNEFIGGNCTVSLLLLACQGLLREKMVESIYSSTYQAMSGAGAAKMQEMVEQIKYIGANANTQQNILDLDKQIQKLVAKNNFPKQIIGYPIIPNIMPWIDTAMNDGRTKEEWKTEAESAKILSGVYTRRKVKMDSMCVRVGAMRCHSQSLLIKLSKNMSIAECEQILASGNKWVKVIPNNDTSTFENLHPAAVSGTLNIAIGRIHQSPMGKKYIKAFTVGDQLLWGAAEPLRRTLKIITNYS